VLTNESELIKQKKPAIIISQDQNNNNNKKQFNDDGDHNNKAVIFDKKIALATESLPAFHERLLRERTCKENALSIADYNIASIRETNISIVTKKTISKH
jgi:hypothetical protein